MDIMTHQHNITPINTVLRVIDVKKKTDFYSHVQFKIHTQIKSKYEFWV